MAAVATVLLLAPALAHAESWSTLHPIGGGRYSTSTGFEVPAIPRVNDGANRIVSTGGRNALEVLGQCCAGRNRIVIRTLVGGRPSGPQQVLPPLGRQVDSRPVLALGPRGRAVAVWAAEQRGRARIVASFSTGPGYRFGAPRVVAQASGGASALHAVWGRDGVTILWLTGYAAAIKYVHGGEGRFGPVQRLARGADVFAERTIAGMFATGGGPVVVWEDTGTHEYYDSTSTSFQLVRPGSTADSPNFGSATPDFGTTFAVVGSSLIVVWAHGSASASGPCTTDDVEAEAFEPTVGFQSPGDLGPAGGSVEELAVAAAGPETAAVAADVAPGRIGGGAECRPSGDIVRAFTFSLTGGSPTPLTDLSRAAPPPAPGQTCGLGCPLWAVGAVPSPAGPIVTWRPASGNTLTAGAAIYR